MAYGVDRPPSFAATDSFQFLEWFATVARWIKGENKTSTQTAAYQATVDDGLVLINGNITVTLPSASTCPGKRITCKAVNAGGGTRTVDGGDSDIDGAATWTTTTQYVSATFQSNGTQWWVI